MDKEVLREIHKHIFRIRPLKLSMVSFVTGLVAIVSVIASFWKGFDLAAVWLLGALISDAQVKASVSSELLKSDHFWPKLGIAFFILFILYLVLLGYHAVGVATRRKNDLEEANQRLGSAKNYRDELAAALGIRFLRVSRFHDILNFDGDSKVTREEVFTVSALKLHHLVRKYQSTCATGRSEPFVDVKGLPPGVSHDQSYKDRADTRYINVYFTPALEKTLEPVTLFVSEDVDRNFVMFKEGIPSEGWSLSESLELVSYRVSEPTDSIVLSVTFPLGYAVQEKSFVRVRYGSTDTPHPGEEARLATVGAVKQANQPGGRLCLSLTIPEPHVGLRYILCWQPPMKAKLEELARRLATPEKPTT